MGARIWGPVGFGIQDPVGAGSGRRWDPSESRIWWELSSHGSWDLERADVWQDRGLAGSGVRKNSGSRIWWELGPVRNWAAGRAGPRGDTVPSLAVRALEKARSSAQLQASYPADNSLYTNPKGSAISAFDGGSNSSSDSEPDEPQNRKKLRMEAS